MKRLKLVLGASLAVAAMAGAGMGAASAQYPVPLGVCIVTPTANMVQTNSTATFTVQTLLQDGAPAPGVSGTVTVTSQPGTGAAPVTSTYVTDSQGRATIAVSTGLAPGSVSVGVTAGTLDCASVVTVVAPRVNPDVIRPPDTGTGSADESAPLAALAIAGLAVTAAGGATAYGVARRRR